MSDQSRHSQRTDPRIQAALREYLERVDRGEVVNREEFLSRHAEIAAALRSFFAAEEPLRKMAATKVSEERAGVSTRSIAAQGQETVPPKAKPDRSPGTSGSALAGQFGRYQIIRALGRGAMGAVYLAEDSQLKRKVAIKTPHFEDDPTGELLKRFYREAEAAATLLNANICPVYDVGEIEGKHFISMAYIDGKPLSDLIKSGKAQHERQIVTAIHKLAKALQQAHDQGIVHRDLKPANIMVNKQGEPVIMDFGLARKRRAEGEASITHSGVLLGSPAYMSPEQIEGDPDNVGPASDQYSLGVVLYEMLTGQLPFRGSVVNVLAQILTKDLTRPSELRPGLDPRIEAVCLRMMAKKTSDRIPSMTAVAEELYAILKSPAAEKSPTASRSPAARAPSRGDAGASQIRKSVKQKVLTESDVTSLEELVRKCLRRHDYDQMIQIIERIPEQRRNDALRALLEKAREKADEIAFLICEIDEADRLKDARTALKKAEELLKIKPGHHRAREIQEKFAGYGEGGAARIGLLRQFTQPWNEGGWIPWSVLAFGVAMFGVMTAVVVIYLGRTAVVIDVKDPGVEVAVKGTTLTVTGPDKQTIKVVPGDQELTITHGHLNFTTKTFALKKGETKTVMISVVDKNVVVKLDGEGISLVPREKAGKFGPLLEKSKVAESSPAKPSGKTDLAELSGSGGIPLLVAPFDAVAAKQGQESCSARLNMPVESTNSIGMKLRLIPPGEFMMGSTKDQIERVESWGATLNQTFKLEQPARRVRILRPFYLGVHEVTRGEFAKFVSATDYKTEAELDRRPPGQEFGEAKGENVDWRNPGYPQTDSHPVVDVTRADAIAFCEWLSRKEGRSYRLPKEAEWEHACRAGTTTLFYTGDDPQKAAQVSNMGGNADGYVFTAPVGSFPSNPFGLYDMCGNVCEICQDRGTPDYVGHTMEGDPPSSADASLRVSRGGSADCPPYYCRPAWRDIELSSDRSNNTGFRVACEIVATTASKTVATTSTKSFGRPFLVRGDWRIENDELFQPALTAGNSWEDDVLPLLVFGHEELMNYDLSLEVKTTAGHDAVGLLFRWMGPAHYRRFVLAGNGGIDFACVSDGKLIRKDNDWKKIEYASERWHTLKIEVRRYTFQAFLDGEPMFTQTDARFALGQLGGTRAATARFGLFTNAAAARFRRIKVSDPGGKVLFEGLPVLPSAKPDVATTNAPAAADILNSSTDPDRRAAEWVLSIGGRIGIDVDRKERDIAAPDRVPPQAFQLRTVRLPGNPKVSDAGLACASGCRNLKALDLYLAKVSDAGLAYIKNCKDLDYLSLGGTQVTDAGLANFKHCEKLAFLGLRDTQVTDAGLANFKHWKNLGHLELIGTRVSDTGLACFKGCKNLWRLDLGDTQVTDRGLALFKNWKKVYWLGVNGTWVTDTGLAYLKDCKNLGVLFLGGTKVNDAGVVYLKSCRNLTVLDLTHTQVTDVTLERLADFRKLVSLVVKGTDVTEKGVKKLAGATPRCKIEWDGGVIGPKL
ncbi:MAG TPA: SUMF1/EgtB/PvdO family nonheme iron enzyme [Planctomycetaceae bacterium]|nr:SUMF1/EgtB/PvdO family nonheme iron enzyme [Planctomycetaceae bacterium]